jgi:hypothetical protein
MRPWRRRRQAPPPVVLPSLDRLAGLIERVVELVDEVAGGGTTAAPQPAPDQHAREPAVTAPRPAATAAPEAGDGRGWIAFVTSSQGYTIVPQTGTAPKPGEVLELDGSAFRVLRHAPSPLPGDDRRCVVVEREEPPGSDRNSGE